MCGHGARDDDRELDGGDDADPAVTLRFGTPKHGWLEIALTGPEGESHDVVSDVPGDSLRDLALAASAVLGGVDARVTWFLEPDQLVWRFRPDGDRVRISAVSGTARSVATRRPTPIGALAARELALLIWRALRRLASDPAWQASDPRTAWTHAFPHRDVDDLGALLGR
ncbi:MAG: hypothetical protein K8W52_28695 [Deltaproteobacteria bacterium]|nr:hypothetical protein [Deltaproteobacteria bacterium]